MPGAVPARDAVGSGTDAGNPPPVRLPGARRPDRGLPVTAGPVVRDVLLRPGDFHFGGAGTRIRTLLGSCVSITMWHPQRQIGGMCHFVVPTRRLGVADDLDGRYADEAVALFLLEIARHRTCPEQYVVKMFGGGSQFPLHPGSGLPHVPSDNIAAGLSLLAAHGFTLSSRHLGGTGARSLAFDITSGDVWLKHVDRPSPGDLA